MLDWLDSSEACEEQLTASALSPRRDDDDLDDDTEDDELIEVTPAAIRLRKRFLSANDRKKLSREAKRERERASL